ncbi:MAG: hypothetical protein ACI9WU_004790 [Myxococcota bacterium]|jgi:hypothetical protein
MTRALFPVAAMTLTLCVGSLSCVGEPVSQIIDVHKAECLGCTSEADMARCGDGIDNDEDQLLDCDDPDCSGFGACNIVLADEENTAALCADGFDNDDNSFVDCADFGCLDTSACKTDVQEPENNDLACSDLLDNDWDSNIDCRDNDCGAVGVTVCERNDATCSDGLDNDGNGFTDCSDFSCSQNNDVTICN